MRRTISVIFALLLVGCTSSKAMLQTANPDENQYRFIFGRMLLNHDKVESLTPEARIANYEKQLNNVLNNDNNTNSCFIIPGTINFGEPGSQGEARVNCHKTVNVQVQEGLFTRDGTAFYSYTLSYE
ncbi:hypothetical protein [Arsukibacterium sp.]|uniref:hypothetical protein n=1 Tax=Arsukibacterium sp. TaxID=1977258 RepID=UPI003566CDC5